MTIKLSQYNIKGSGGYDVYHFETSVGQVKVLDKNKNVLGTLKEFAHEGKVITSGKATDIKATGLYKIKNVTGLPSEVEVGKIAILAVTAVGETNNPEMIKYELISQAGAVYTKIVVPGSSSTDWVDGGIRVDNAISLLNTKVGNTDALTTGVKTNLVAAINEVDKNADSIASNLSKHLTDYNTFKKHNHDDRYILKKGDTINGNLKFKSGTGIQGIDKNNKTINLLTQTGGGAYELGNSSTALNISASNDLTHNGKKIWTEVNDGKGSGLDADKFQGFDLAEFALVNGQNDFTQDIGLTNKKSIIFKMEGNYPGFHWRDKKDNATTLIRINGRSDYGLNFYTGGKNGDTYTWLNGNGEINSKRKIFLNSKNGVEVGLNLKLSDGDKGMGFYRNQSSKYFGMYDWNHSKRIFYVDQNDQTIYFDNAISINKRKLYLQSGTPGGSHSTGDIWIS